LIVNFAVAASLGVCPTAMATASIVSFPESAIAPEYFVD